MPLTVLAAVPQAVPFMVKAGLAGAAFLAGKAARVYRRHSYNTKTGKGSKGRSKARSRNMTHRTAKLKQQMQAGWTNAIRDNFIPIQQNVDFTWSFSRQVESIAGTVLQTGIEDIYRLNSPFDPSLSFVTHQPRNWDQAMALYTRYKVFAVTIELRWNSDANTDIMHGISMVQPSSEVFTIANKPVYQTRECFGTDERVMAPNGQMTWYVAQKIYIPTLEGIAGTGADFSDQFYSAANGANPIKVPLLRVAAANASSTVATTLKYDITLTFHTRIYQRITQASS